MLSRWGRVGAQGSGGTWGEGFRAQADPYSSKVEVGGESKLKLPYTLSTLDSRVKHQKAPRSTNDYNDYNEYGGQ